MYKYIIVLSEPSGIERILTYTKFLLKLSIVLSEPSGIERYPNRFIISFLILMFYLNLVELKEIVLWIICKY